MFKDFTFSIIKPNAVRTGRIGPVLSMINEAGFEIAARKMVRLTRYQAEEFYAVHRERSFYPGLIEFMTSGPVVVMVLKHDNAVEQYRKLMGPTDPTKAPKGTIRAEFGVNTQMNAVHGSDSVENAHKEANFFFSSFEVY